MDIKEIEGIWAAFQEVQEKKLSAKQKKHFDKDNDGDIDGEDMAALNKKEETECPKCKGKGCDHCDGKGVHEEAPADPVKKAPARKGDKANADKTELQAQRACEEADWLADLALQLDELNKADHTKGATSPEGIADKESPKSKEFMDMHKKSNKEIEDKEEQGHKDVVKAGQATKPAPALGSSYQLANGDKAVVKPVKEAYRIYTESVRQIEESNLGHLAAKHFQHYGNSNSESGHRNPERASQAAAQTLNRIKSVHGASAAAAVKQHSADADNHDNGTVSSGKKGFHSDFVKKHLGGSGSEEHKAYKSHMDKMGYTKKNLGMKTHHE